jgi:dCTP deaminase
MILSDEGIRKALESGAIVIDPPPKPEQFQTSALDIFLGERFTAWDIELLKTQGFEGVLDLAKQKFLITAQRFSKEIPKERDGSVILPPYGKVPQVILCQTRERISLTPDSCLAARVEGRSSLARLGVMVHLTAPTIHAGFNGNITLEVMNHGPFHLKLMPNELIICQFIFETLSSKPTGQIQTVFQNQNTPAAGKL